MDKTLNILLVEPGMGIEPISAVYTAGFSLSETAARRLNRSAFGG